MVYEWAKPAEHWQDTAILEIKKWSEMFLIISAIIHTK